MLNKADKQFLKENFATKDDLRSMEDRQNKRFATKDDLVMVLKPIKASLRKLNRKLTTTIKFFDPTIMNHKKRIDRIEKHFDLPPLAD